MTIISASPEHQVAYDEIRALVGRHAGSVTALELLALAANMVGKIIAFQDQRTMTSEQAIEIVMRNIEIGNRQATEDVLHPVGRA